MLSRGWAQFPAQIDRHPRLEARAYCAGEPGNMSASASINFLIQMRTSAARTVAHQKGTACPARVAQARYPSAQVNSGVGSPTP